MNTPLSTLHQARLQRGLSLVELMISMTIGLFLLAGLATVYLNSAQSSAELNKSAQQVENGRFAMQTITDDLRHAGFYGQYYTATVPGATDPMPSPCEYGAGGPPYTAVRYALLLPVQGYGAWDAALAACLPPSNHKGGTDILVIRRADSTETTGANFEVGRVYVQANASGEAANPVVSAATSTTGTLGLGNTFFLVDRTNQPAPVRRLHIHVYFVSPCSKPLVCTGAGSDDGIPTLKRLELVNGGFSVVPIAEGIENLQFDYGVDADGDGAAEAPFVENPANAQAWGNVVAVNVNLIARALEPSPGYSDPKTYQLGDFVSWTPAGTALTFKRHAYSELARIVNVSGRREMP